MSVNKEKRRPDVSECLDVFLLSLLQPGGIIKKSKVCLLACADRKKENVYGRKRLFHFGGCKKERCGGICTSLLGEGLLKVPRNAKGHRCYTEAEFAAIRDIQKMKAEGLSIKDIRDVKEHPKSRENREHTENKKKDYDRENACTVDSVSAVEEDKKQQFYVILERLVKEISLTRNREARYRRLDEAIRRQQESRRMTAASQEKSEHAKRK